MSTPAAMPRPRARRSTEPAGGMAAAREPAAGTVLRLARDLGMAAGVLMSPLY